MRLHESHFTEIADDPSHSSPYQLASYRSWQAMEKGVVDGMLPCSYPLGREPWIAVSINCVFFRYRTEQWYAFIIFAYWRPFLELLVYFYAGGSQ
jgi:hypothetical protein